MDVVSIIIRRASWLIPFGVFGSVLTCITPFVLAYYPIDKIMFYILFCVVYITLFGLCALVVLAVERVSGFMPNKNNEPLLVSCQSCRMGIPEDANYCAYCMAKQEN